MGLLVRGETREPAARHSALLAVEFRIWAERLSHEPLRVSADDVVAELADGFIAEPLVERSRSRVEGRDAEKDVGGIAKDPLLGEPNQPPAKATRAPSGVDGDRPDVADERAFHDEDHEPDDCAVVHGDVGLLNVAVAEDALRLLH